MFFWSNLSMVMRNIFLFFLVKTIVFLFRQDCSLYIKNIQRVKDENKKYDNVNKFFCDAIHC